MSKAPASDWPDVSPAGLRKMAEIAAPNNGRVFRAAADEIERLAAQPVAQAPEPMRAHVEQFATRAGWNKDEGEGAFEFVQRKCYHQGWQDGRREALGDVHRDTPEVAATQPTKPEQQAGGVPAGFPPRIMKLLLDVADRECKGHQGPWEDGDGVPLDAVARQAVEWIEARAALSTQPQHEGWKMVPVKATTPMINAGQCGCMDNDVTVCVYDAILAAAPSQSAVQPT